MKKWGPFIVTGAILLYFLIFKKRAAAGGLQSFGGSANTADNAKRPAPRLQGNNSGLLSSLIGAGSNLLGSLLRRPSGGGGGGGSGSGAGTQLPLRRPPEEKPPPNPPYVPKTPGVNDTPGSGSGSGYDFSYRNDETNTTLLWQSGEFNPFDNPNDVGGELYSGAPPFEGYTGRDLAPISAVPGYESDFGGELPKQQVIDTGAFNQSLIEGNFASSGENPIAHIPGYYDATDNIFAGNVDLGQSDLVQAGDNNFIAGIDPNNAFGYGDYYDPFQGFYDFGNFDYPSGSYGTYPDLYSGDSGYSGDEKRGGGGYTPNYSPSSSGGGGAAVPPSAYPGGVLPGTNIPVSYYPSYGKRGRA